MFNFNKTQIYLILGLVFLIVVFSLALVLQPRSTLVEPSPSPDAIPIFSPSPAVTSKPIEIKPILSNKVPLKPVAEGGGVDLNSSLVQQSQNEIAKILPLLPYQDSFVASTGKTISVLLPTAQYQTTPWVLDAEIYGINYQASPADDDYNLQKQAFLDAASRIFTWLERSGVNPEKIIINWGDRAYIRETAEEWLR